MAYLPPYTNYKFGQPVPKVATYAQYAEVRKLADFTQYVWPNVTKNWSEAVSISSDNHLNTCLFVWMYDTDYARYGYQGVFTSLDGYIAAAKAAGKIISAPQRPTAAQAEILRCCPDFQNVIEAVWRANSSKDPTTGVVTSTVDKTDVAHIMELWSETAAFKRDYGTIEKYLAAKCAGVKPGCGGGNGGGSGSGDILTPPSDMSPEGIMAWLQADPLRPIIGVVVGYAAYSFLFRKRRR